MRDLPDGGITAEMLAQISAYAGLELDRKSLEEIAARLTAMIGALDSVDDLELADVPPYYALPIPQG
ncbi:MAG: hypothetical protein HY531_01335 [Chloroflexi bacterium]|nr:hypothetical protein [Chloroflexota bacterium]